MNATIKSNTLDKRPSTAAEELSAPTTYTCDSMSLAPATTKIILPSNAASALSKAAESASEESIINLPVQLTQLTRATKRSTC
jgi:hypothetical protein